MCNCSKRAIATIFFACLAIMACAHLGSSKKVEYKKVEHKIPPQAIYEFSRLIHRGGLHEAHPGKPGLDIKTFKLVIVHGHVISKTLVKEETSKPINALYLMSRFGYLPSRHEFKRGKIMRVVATGYDPSASSNGGYGGRTATGRRAQYGCIAVDPRVIPLGSLIYVEGYGFGIACDTGGAIQGHRIDLCFSNNHEANNWGRRQVTIHIMRR